MCRFLLLLLLAGAAFGADVTGEWEFQLKRFGDTQYLHLNLQADGSKLSGKLDGVNLGGTIQGNDLSLSASHAGGEKFATLHGQFRNNTLSGNGTWDKGEVTWVAHRPTAPPSQPKTYDFEPKEFHRLFSDAIPPVLHIFPGDTVRTWTVDAGGKDQKGVSRSIGGNPETGPFYVEGAFPGDTLVVKLNRVRLNRDSAVGGDSIVDSALQSYYVRQTKYDDNFDSNWVLDREKGVARLKKPSDRMKDYTVKLSPMLGCIAVAPPAHQAARTGFLGSYGGNMDYNQMREGTTLYLPVYAPGALLFVGDGHAAQGDGELNGDALETSMDVEFTVDLVKGKSTDCPRAENDEYLMSMGIANSLPEALQTATTQLVNWLQSDYKLEPNDAAVVLGTAVRYDIAEVVDPLVHVVAKIRKDALAGIRK